MESGRRAYKISAFSSSERTRVEAAPAPFQLALKMLIVVAFLGIVPCNQQQHSVIFLKKAIKQHIHEEFVPAISSKDSFHVGECLEFAFRVCTSKYSLYIIFD
jgi:hypothetical protein